MSCVIALRDDATKTVFIGSDGRVIVDGLTVDSAARVFEKNDFVFGYSKPSDYKLVISKLDLSYDPSTVNDEFFLFEFLENVFVPQFKKSFDKIGFRIKGLMHDGILVGFSDKLCLIDDDFEVVKIDTAFWTLGSGASIANGSLFSTKTMTGPDLRIRLALEAAAAHDITVGPAFDVKQTKSLLTV